jgi:hypothetical protein
MLGRLAVFGVGYVIGTRAGRERYDTIRSVATWLVGRLEDRARTSAESLGQGDRGPTTTSKS